MHVIASFLLLVPVLQAEPATNQSAAPASQPASQPAEPEWTLYSGHRAETGDESAYVASRRKQQDELESKAAAAGDPVVAARYRLAAVNVALAMQLEPVASRRLLALSAASDEETARALIAQSMQRLESIIAAMAPAADPESDPYKQLRATAEALRAFAAALSAVWSPDSGESLTAARQSALAGLAAYLEDDRAEVAAAALLWQGLLYKQLEQAERTLELLPAPTARVAQKARFFQFHARLLRCRMVGQRGGHAAALALLLQVEDKALEWFTVEAEQEAAVRAATLLRVQILRDWRASLDAKETAVIAWCEQGIGRAIRDATGPDEPPVVLGLERAVPILAPSPDDKLAVEQEGEPEDE